MSAIGCQAVSSGKNAIFTEALPAAVEVTHSVTFSHNVPTPAGKARSNPVQIVHIVVQVFTSLVKCPADCPAPPRISAQRGFTGWALQWDTSRIGFTAETSFLSGERSNGLSAS